MDTLTPAALYITPEILRLVAEIDECKGAWKALGMLPQERLVALRRVAAIESIGSALRMERRLEARMVGGALQDGVAVAGVLHGGADGALQDGAVERLLDHFDGSFVTRDEQDVLGYAQTLEQVWESFAQHPLTEDRIRQLHRDLLRHSPKGKWHRGHYKTSANSAGNQEAGFEPATPLAAPYRVRELVEWAQTALNSERRTAPDGENRATPDSASMHPLLAISIFTATFLLIQPFQEGNTRLSCILTAFLLLRSGYAYAPYGSLENVMEHSGDDYSRALRQAQGTKRATPDWQPWLLCFLRALHRHMRRVEQKMEREHRILAALPELSLRIVEHVRENGRATLKDMTILTDASRNTLKGHLRRLAASGRIVMRGKGRGVWYSLR